MIINWIRNRIVRKAREKLADDLIFSRDKIFPIDTDSKFNSRCHDNCAQYISDHKDEELDLIECIYVEDDTWPILHYLVRNDKGEYLELTLGRYAEVHRYYKIRVIRNPQYVLGIFEGALEYWSKRYITGWKRIFAGKEKIV